MSNLSIQLDPVALREATSQAIMGILTPEMKAKILEDAVRALLTPSTNSWDRNRSPIQIAFDQAVVQVANQVAREHIEADQEIKGRLKTMVASVAAKVLAMDADKMAEKMADAFVSSMRAER